jgi:uncharacterized membrane protein
MSNFFKRQRAWLEMLRQPYFRWVWSLALLIWLVITGLITFKTVPIIYKKTAVPLHYNIHFGVDTIGQWWHIYLVPAIGLVILLVNFILATFMWSKESVLAYLAATATLVLQIILLVATIFIVSLSLAYA